MAAKTEKPIKHHDESKLSARLNWLRAGVLGANDGIVSIAALVVGVAAATPEYNAILTAGAAGLAAGALSMGVGEYVSVSSQKDAERAQLDRERKLHEDSPEVELQELIEMNEAMGLNPITARLAAIEQTKHDAFGTHARMELGIDPNALVSPMHAAVASLIAFTLGGIPPILTILLAPASVRVPLTFFTVLLALAATGWGSARLGHAPRLRAILRNIAGGAIAMSVTYGIGALVGAQI